MDRLRFSSIAHRDHTFCSPLSELKANQLVALLGLPEGARVLDAGCGKAELLLRIMERYRARGIGVDLSPYFIADAKRRAAGRVPAGELALHEMDLAEFTVEPGSLELAVCIGATWLYGGYRGALEALARAVRPGGSILLGEPYWRRPPDPAYLELLGAKGDEHLDHAGTVRAGLEKGLRLLYFAASSEDDWDFYQGLYCLTVERHAIEHPEDPDVPEMLERVRKMRDSYHAWGRETLGFGFYLFGT